MLLPSGGQPGFILKFRLVLLLLTPTHLTSGAPAGGFLSPLHRSRRNVMRAEFRPYRLVIVYTKYGLYCVLVCTNMSCLIAIEVISFMYHLEDPRDPFLTGNCAANATFQPKYPTIQNTAFKNKLTETAKKQLPVTTDLVSNDNLTTVLSGLECSSWIWTFSSYMDLCPIMLRVKRFLVSDSGFCLWFWFLVSGPCFCLWF